VAAARGRHAPPLEIRLPRQRERLLQAAAQEFALRGYRSASSDSISRRAAMSKATFYEHFEDKEECILALRDEATQMVYEALWQASRAVPADDPRQRMRVCIGAFLQTLADQPELTQTVLVEIVGAGPRATQSRDRILQVFAEAIDAENEQAAGLGLAQRLRSPHDAMAVAGAAVELVSRQVRLGVPARMLDLQPVLERLVFGLLAPTPTPTPTPAPR
jgi:AcrR family transcriptional regulator